MDEGPMRLAGMNSGGFTSSMTIAFGWHFRTQMPQPTHFSLLMTATGVLLPATVFISIASKQHAGTQSLQPLHSLLSTLGRKRLGDKAAATLSPRMMGFSTRQASPQQ